MVVFRYADDVDLNTELKQRYSWANPGPQFITKVGRRATEKPLCQGRMPSNWYGIQQGRGRERADRSNRFEEYFAVQSRG